MIQNAQRINKKESEKRSNLIRVKICMRERRAKRAARTRRMMETAIMNICLIAAKTIAEMAPMTQRTASITILL